MLDKTVVSVAPTAHVYPIPEDKIPQDQKSLEASKDTFSAFNYYVVELGLNVLLDKGVKITKLLFEVDLKCDQDRIDVTAYDIMPDDRIKNIKIVDGKISVGITKLLKFLPAPLGQVMPDVLDINISREFKWGFDKYEIDAAGEKDYRIYWKIYDTNVAQGFSPRMIIKAKKGVSEITGTVSCTYKLEKWFGLSWVEIKSEDKEIKIWPL
ncbi:MAG: hypothetical protein CVT88_05425 [Candidatus Altiarchaeales archaeon HGW-Altiarchaeales-1]|nr:MAG: hypothetical protein CVT88_05425 [Candidatus Altiarchaeales archaeon HGW-Altiarchaeales-1]